MVRLEGGEFTMGTDDPPRFPNDGEGPSYRVRVEGFWVDPHAVTNAQYATFVKASGYVTDAERYGWSYVFEGFVAPQVERISGRRASGIPPWWAAVPGATWKHPEGPGSSITGRQNHPVVHVSWNDAMAYVSWAEARLPTEPEWEYAARGGLVAARFPWGDELLPKDRWRCNIWQGRFPDHNTGDDGFVGTAPVDAFPPNGYGLHNVVGNVWEWCADPFDALADVAQVVEGSVPGGLPPRPDHVAMRGGSYLCHDSYCNRYRVAARTSNPADTSAGNLGFRCVADREVGAGVPAPPDRTETA